MRRCNSAHLAKLNADATFGAAPAQTKKRKKRWDDDSEEELEEQRQIVQISERYSYEFVVDPISPVTRAAQDLLRQGRMPSSAKIIPTIGTQEMFSKGVRCLVLYCDQVPVSTAVYRITTASERARSTFLEIGSFATDTRVRRCGAGRLLVGVLKTLAWKAECSVLLVHSRTNSEAKRFWTAMNFTGACRFTCALKMANGGDWGWEDTEEMEQPVNHMPHIRDALNRVTQEAPVRVSVPGSVVWARLQLPVGGTRWIPSVVIKSNSSSDYDVFSLEGRDIFEGVRDAEIRSFKEFQSELLPREGDVGWAAVEEARERTKDERRLEDEIVDDNFPDILRELCREVLLVTMLDYDMLPDANAAEAQVAQELEHKLTMSMGKTRSTAAAALKEQMLQKPGPDSDRVTAALMQQPTHAPLPVRRAPQKKAPSESAAPKVPKVPVIPANVQIQMLDLNDLTVYEALDDETPKRIAKKFGLEAKGVVTLNRERYPGLTQNSKLMEGTSLLLPITEAMRATGKYQSLAELEGAADEDDEEAGAFDHGIDEQDEDPWAGYGDDPQEQQQQQQQQQQQYHPQQQQQQQQQHQPQQQQQHQQYQSHTYQQQYGQPQVQPPFPQRQQQPPQPMHQYQRSMMQQQPRPYSPQQVTSQALHTQRYPTTSLAPPLSHMNTAIQAPNLHPPTMSIAAGPPPHPITASLSTGSHPPPTMATTQIVVSPTKRAITNSAGLLGSQTHPGAGLQPGQGLLCGPHSGLIQPASVGVAQPNSPHPLMQPAKVPVPQPNGTVSHLQQACSQHNAADNQNFAHLPQTSQPQL